MIMVDIDLDEILVDTEVVMVPEVLADVQVKTQTFHCYKIHYFDTLTAYFHYEFPLLEIL